MGFVLLRSELGAVAAAGAVLLFMATVLWGQALKARRLGQRASDHEETDLIWGRPAKVRRLAQRGSHHEVTGPSTSSRADVQVPAIFLSHSGKQKPFVEHLYNALLSANHTAFFDQHSLPKGSPFPPHIKRAAHNCKLGVIVLSDDFLTSKWPMLELEMLVLQRGPDANVFPLFYKLRPEDLKSRKNLTKWRRVWTKKVGQCVADQWERAVKALNSFNGEVFAEGTSEATYINKVVHHICTCVPCHAPYDVSWIQGHQRLAKEIVRRFEHEDARQCEEASMVGLHGVGGLGKTTMCKSMVNFYQSQYRGRSALIEFPTHTHGDDKLKIVQECKKALKELTNLSDKHLFNKADSFDQVVQLMREHVRRYDVFLAIDNVWESSREEADRILRVGFTPNSKILLTSRSEQLLQDLLWGHKNSVGPLPALEYEEAFQIFQKTFNLGDLKSSVNRHQIDRVLERCRFSGNYHALALKALSQHVKGVCALGDTERIGHHLALILEEISNADLQNVEDVIRLNYDNLPQHKRHMFLDIAVLVKQDVDDEHIYMDELTYAKAYQWLGFLYKEFPGTKITRLLYELALDGLIQIEVDGRVDEKMIRVHELFFELAQREAASSSRFFTTKGSTKSVEEIEWERLQRVILRGEKDPYFIEKLQQQECPKLQVLYAVDIKSRSGIHLDLMPSLCILTLKRVTLLSNENWSAATGSETLEPLEPSSSVSSLKDLTIKNARGDITTVEGLHAPRVLNLICLVQLQMLCIEACSFVERIAGLEDLKNLRMLYIERCPCLKNLDGLSGLIQLEVLDVETCASLKKMPDLSGLTHLERLQLSGNGSMEVVGCLGSALKHVRVAWCGALKKMPDLSALTCLDRLELVGNQSMEEVGCLGSALKDLHVVDCWALKKMPDLSGLICLERLELSDNGSMEEVGGQYVSPNVEDLRIEGCKRLRRFPSLSDCVHLKKLGASACHMNGVLNDEWKHLTSLQTLRINDRNIVECDSVKMEVRCLSALTNLKRVEVRHCCTLEEIGDLSALNSLEELHLYDCPRLRKVGGLMGIKCLSLQDCGSLKESTVPDVRLRSMEYVRMSHRKRVEELNKDFSAKTGDAKGEQVAHRKGK